MKPRCFVASPIGRIDVDKFFKGTIRAACTKVGLQAIRVDGQHDNAPIDEKVYREMKRADLCIADLTYARPSVYFEAGYMRGRGKQVVLTCRADHFKKRAAEDPDVETLRVHFDLEQEDIIPWSNGIDSDAMRRLVARLRSVCAPLFDAQRASDKLEKARSDFAAQPIMDRLNRVHARVTELLLEAGWKASTSEDGSPTRVPRYESTVHDMWTRRRGVRAEVMLTAVRSVLGRKALRGSLEALRWVDGLAKQIPEIHFHCVIFCLASVSANAVERAMPHWQPQHGEDVRSMAYCTGASDEDPRAVLDQFHVLHRIKSMPELGLSMTALLKHVDDTADLLTPDARERVKEKLKALKSKEKQRGHRNY